eukprot:235268-Pleurochrysis_carterae.AAC.1
MNFGKALLLPGAGDALPRLSAGLRRSGLRAAVDAGLSERRLRSSTPSSVLDSPFETPSSGTCVTHAHEAACVRRRFVAQRTGSCGCRERRAC